MPADIMERVAQAIASAEYGDGYNRPGDPFLPHARAAIEAMRIPTFDMKMAGAEAISVEIMRINANYDAVIDAWPAMITAALK